MRYSLVTGIAAALFLTACQTEQRTVNPPLQQRATYVEARESPIVPGGPIPQAVIKSPSEGRAYDISEGKRLFNWYNCSGCHANGGGGMGPPLMSQKFLYGNSPDNIFDTIQKGRPHGMPLWGGKIPENQIWQIVAYVRSLSGQEPAMTTGGRSDHMEKKTAAQLK